MQLALRKTDFVPHLRGTHLHAQCLFCASPAKGFLFFRRIDLFETFDPHHFCDSAHFYRHHFFARVNFGELKASSSMDIANLNALKV